MLQKIKDYQAKALLVMAISIMALGSMVEFNLAGIAIFGSLLVLSIGALLFFKKAERVYLEQRNSGKMVIKPSERKNKEVA